MKAGVAISPDTPSTAITDEIGNMADMLLVMTVYPGQLVQLSVSYVVTESEPTRQGWPEIPRQMRAKGDRAA